MPDNLSIARKLSYGVGHVLNDLCASMWFSYLLIYFHRIVLFNDSLAGYMMLLGQIADAIATPFVGFESDKTVRGFCNYGRRKSWHLIGCLCVLMSFPFLYNLCIGCANTVNWAKFIYYAPFVVIFQFGWAATQISHLSLIPELTPCENERVALNSIRYAFTVISNVFVYGVTYLLLQFKKDSSKDSDEIDPSDAPKFMILSFIICGVGLLFQIIFHVGTKENSDRQEYERTERTNSFVMERRLNWFGYLKTYRFYQVGLLYMCTRLTVNVSQVYLPMYVTDTVTLNKTYIAIIPLVSYVSGFFSSFAMRSINKHIGRNFTYVVGVLQICGFCALMWCKNIVYDEAVNAVCAAILLGSGGSTILITSLSMTSDLIGDNTNTGAFVYGAMSFSDKLSNGLAVALLQQFSPCSIHTTACSCQDYYRYIMTFLPSACSITALISVLLLHLGRRNRRLNTDTNVNTEIVDETTPILQH